LAGAPSLVPAAIGSQTIGGRSGRREHARATSAVRGFFRNRMMIPFILRIRALSTKLCAERFASQPCDRATARFPLRRDYVIFRAIRASNTPARKSSPAFDASDSRNRANTAKHSVAGARIGGWAVGNLANQKKHGATHWRVARTKTP